MTFWELVNEYTVEIPLIQRDYAQGRPLDIDKNAAQIRETLLNEIFEALRNDNQSKELNFIYGSVRDNKFIPIDGQQRLTTLFLLHWYVLWRTNSTDSEWNYLKKFSYKSRVSSDNFCENICNQHGNIQLENGLISHQIKDMSWFTPDYETDPTIKSMLVMLDDIHKHANNNDNWANIKNNLINGNVIFFMWLDINNPANDQQENNDGNAAINITNVEDLYMKMNSRGKQLTDFEIFKARLQNYEILDDLCIAARERNNNAEPDLTEKTQYISKYNNEFTDCFFKIFNANGFDEAMFIFVKIMIRDAVLQSASSNGVNQKDYREAYKEFKQNFLSADLNKLIESGECKGLTTTENYDAEQVKNATKEALKKTYKLLDMLSRIEENAEKQKLFSTDVFNNRQYILHLLKQLEQPTNADDFRRYAVFSYLLKFNIPSNDDTAFKTWARFIEKLAINSDFQNAEETVESFSFIKYLLTKINNSTENDILTAIQNINIDTPDPEYEDQMKIDHYSRTISLQIKEESIKAGLIYDNNKINEQWKKNIENAENHFNGGHIYFLLYSSKNEQVYDLEIFKKNLGTIKSILDENYIIINKIYAQLLLCYANTLKNTILCPAKNTFAIYGVPLKNLLKDENKYITIKSFLQKYNSQDKDLPIYANEEISSVVQDHVKNGFEGLINIELWKKLILLDPINQYINSWGILLLTGKTANSYSNDINVCLLKRYIEIKNPNKKWNFQLCTAKSSSLVNDKGLPTRYLKFNNHNIGYDYSKQKWVIWTNDSATAVDVENDKIVNHIMTL